MKHTDAEGGNTPQPPGANEQDTERRKAMKDAEDRRGVERSEEELPASKQLDGPPGRKDR